MIPLRIKAEVAKGAPAFVVRLRSSHDATVPHEDDAFLEGGEATAPEYATVYGRLRLTGLTADELQNDVLLVVPDRGTAHRLIRASSKYNSLLVTERCDQLCVMCSQPPKPRHVDLFPLLERAAVLAPERATLVLTGGEPTLFKDDLFHFFDTVSAKRPDLRFQVLTNGQHFEDGDAGRLTRLAATVLWGIPLYASSAELHDAIVKKGGAYQRLGQSLALLAKAGSQIQLRTVAMANNVAGLPELARFITSQVPFVATWAIMQLENIGYGRQNWANLFFDNSQDFGPIGSATDIARAHGIDVSLFNFPLCTVPLAYRTHAVASISDWKRRYLSGCESCALRQSCGGFFEWYPDRSGFTKLGLQ
jgi:His-Xaa-Ser system radical SAM maturase HxsC